MREPGSLKRRHLGLALVFVFAGGALLAGSSLATETILTLDGQRVLGEVVGESATELTLRTAHGTILIPKPEILARRVSGGRQRNSPAASLPDPAQLRTLREQARQLLARGRLQDAVAAYAALLKLVPGDANALYNTACVFARLGRRDQAVAFLGEAVAAGFVDFGHVRTDPDLRSLRGSRGYERLLTEAESWTKRAVRNRTRSLQSELRNQGARAEYRVLEDDETGFVYLHTKPPERLSFVQGGLALYTGLQRRDLFLRAAASPLHIVLLAPNDSGTVLPKGVGGLFRPASNTLVCGDMPAAVLFRSNVVIHELTHAIHFADQTARNQRHPIWLIEGLATLFESATVVDDRLVPRHSARLATLRRATRKKALIPWRELMQLEQPAFMQKASIAYPQSRYILFYAWEQGRLERFYEGYTRSSGYQSDRSGIEALEVAFGKPLDEIHRDWEVWLGEKRAPPTPYLGLSTEPATGGGLEITMVRPGSAAANGGLQLGDVLVSMDGVAMGTVADLLEVLSTRAVGDELFVEVVRGEQTLQVYLTLGRRGGQ